MYTKQKLQVRWGTSMSSQFTACNGVKQGAILSPILISIHMDGLFEQLEKSGVACHMGNHYTGCIEYADDITLLTPTRSGLKVLIDICEKYAHEHCVNFNGSKSRYLSFRGRNCKPDSKTVFFNDTELYSTQDYPVLVILKQRFSKCIHKAMNRNSPIINSVVKLSIANPWSNCSANYHHILNECDTMYDMCV